MTTEHPCPLILHLAGICDTHISRAELARALGVPTSRVTFLLGSKANPATSSPSVATVNRLLAVVNAKTGRNYTLLILEQ